MRSLPKCQHTRPTRSASWVVAGLFLGFSLVRHLLPRVAAADWPQFRGPNHNGVSNESNWSTRWPQEGPKKLWKANVGIGYSAVAVSRGRVYTMGSKGGTDTVFCLDAATGRVVWKQSYRCPPKQYPGPRATPTVEGSRVYTLSSEAQLYCFNASSGKVLWSRDLKKDHRLNAPTWGFAGSPLVEGKLLILNCGTAGLAVDKATGKTLWQSGSEAAGYATPVALNMGGQRCIAVFGRAAVAGVDSKSGKQLWQHPWQTKDDVNAADPIVSGDKVFISSNYGKGCALLRVSKGKASVVWQNRSLKNHFATSVLVGGYLYGNDEGTLRCVDFNTGAAKWSKGGLGKGQLICAAGKLIIITQRGELIIAQATPGSYKELAKAQVLSGTCWTAPVLSGGRIYCRNQEGDLVCMDVKGK